ncbi:MAG: lysophospholipid acyltransferase family protein [Bacteroidia bacterium]|nr:lysophospholipid acyltransferase family protein [Bacteroidia bacterium]
MLTATPSVWGRFFWETFCQWAMKFYFRKMEHIGDVKIASDKALLLMGNHISWWDGFWPLVLNKRFFQKKYHVMMLESELRKRPFMRKGGAFSIEPGNRSMVETIRYTAGLLENPANMVLMYPQGKIHSIYDDKFVFQPGLEKIHQRCHQPFQTVFFAAMLDYGSFPRPLLRMYLGEYSGGFSAEEITQAYKQFYATAREEQKQRVPAAI